MYRQNLKLTWVDKLYLPAIIKGMWVTWKHLIRPHKYATQQYPEVKVDKPDGFRGYHRLNKDEQGRIKCVACEMCSTACPSNCITIVPEPTPAEWTDRERMPKVFQIDLLRCIFCGMCQEACPKEAIELTRIFDWAGYTREEFLWNKDKLLEMYDKTTSEDFMKTMNLSVNPPVPDRPKR
ncbi:MAG: NADH-quinone oxidoreductase subunit I [bacterium]|nr:NADH-quinone oxidoreductase subunit I [bacterium]